MGEAINFLWLIYGHTQSSRGEPSNIILGLAMVIYYMIYAWLVAKNRRWSFDGLWQILILITMMWLTY